MGKTKTKSRDQSADENDETTEEGFFNGTILALGSILVVLIGVLASQLGDIVRFINTGEKMIHPNESRHADGRGVKGITLHPDMDVAATVTPFVERNEPFVCRHCIPKRRLEFWSNDSGMLETVGPDADLPNGHLHRLKVVPYSVD
mmetsp:Transcript_36136/g.53900  ORF Transcript_36136/g.53900 Transcript_36136/m.53900 type:complete len:146 (+) Transcript_36136:552-989(+)